MDGERPPSLELPQPRAESANVARRTWERDQDSPGTGLGRRGVRAGEPQDLAGNLLPKIASHIRIFEDHVPSLIQR